MGKPAARITDMHTCPMVTPGVPPIPHVGGPITGPGVPTVLIGGVPAAVMGDMCTCVGPPDTIILGSTGVMIGGKPAARMGDTTAHGGVIMGGLPTVLIGEVGVVIINKLILINADPPFSCGKGHTVAEFERQIKGQQLGMNKLTVAEFLENRKAYKAVGRSKGSKKAQKEYREQKEQEEYHKYRGEGYSKSEAKQKAMKYMEDKAALHDPDQVAGGHSTKLTGLGNTNVNSSIGSQWKTRIESIESQVRKQCENMTPEQMQNIYLNVHLYP